MFIVKGEHGRMLSDMTNVKKMYANVVGENKVLIRELDKRS